MDRPGQKIYFHFGLECLKKFDPTLDIATITMSDEIFYNITDQHLSHLETLGILKHIIVNKGKQVAVSVVQ